MTVTDLSPSEWPHDECPQCGDAADVVPVEDAQFLYCNHCRKSFGYRGPLPWEVPDL